MKKIKNKSGVSTIEFFCITFIVVVAVILIALGFRWYHIKMCMGNDQMLVNTAESAARINAVGSECPVRGCDGGECIHKTEEGYVGYFYRPSNSVRGKKGVGYNEYKIMKIGDEEYYGEPGTMIIQIVNHDGELTLSWVEGDN